MTDNRPEFKCSQDPLTTCRICGGKLTPILDKIFDTRFGIPGNYSVAICGACGLEQTTPAVSEAALKNLYEEHYNYGGERGTLYTYLREKFLFSWLYKIWMLLDGDISFHSLKGEGRLLDVGCNEGRGLKLYRNNGFNPEGLELNALAAKAARSAGFTVYSELLEDFLPSAPYKIVILANVLEHSTAPKRMLLDVRRILAPGGAVMISCPNRNSFLRAVFGRYWINWHVPFHVTHFSPESLSALLKDSGFDTIEIRCASPALWLVHSLLAMAFSKEGKKNTALRNPAAVCLLMLLARVFLFPVLVIANMAGKGDCLVVSAKGSSK